MFSATVLVALAFATAEPETVEIPLNSIWAHDMPATKNVAELEADAHGNVPKADRDRSIALGIRKSLQYQVGRGPGEGFAVIGTGRSALQAAHDVLTSKKQRRSEFSAGSEISIIFFSCQFGAYVNLDSVKRKGNVIEVHYHFVPHMTKNMTEQFAIIPLGKLEPAHYGVDIKQAPMDTKILPPGSKPINRDWERDVICEPFSFDVANDK